MQHSLTTPDHFFQKQKENHLLLCDKQYNYIGVIKWLRICILRPCVIILNYSIIMMILGVVNTFVTHVVFL